jgi:hypothetical protein
MKVKCFLCENVDVEVGEVGIRKVCPGCAAAMVEGLSDGYVLARAVREKDRKRQYDRDNARRRQEVLKRARERNKERLRFVLEVSDQSDQDPNEM